MLPAVFFFLGMTKYEMTIRERKAKGRKGKRAKRRKGQKGKKFDYNYRQTEPKP